MAVDGNRVETKVTVNSSHPHLNVAFSIHKKGCIQAFMASLHHDNNMSKRINSISLRREEKRREEKRREEKRREGVMGEHVQTRQA